MQKPQIIIIAGPTASGKSGLALDLAKRSNGVIINADSMQVYKDIPILAAAPSIEDKTLVPHKLYGIYNAEYRGNVVDWLNLCKKEIDQCIKKNQTPIVVGGTGLYLENLKSGTTPIPETSQEIRDKVDEILKNKGLTHLYTYLKKIDNKTASRLSENDTTRIRRAVEIYMHTKKPLSYWHTLPMVKNYDDTSFLSIYIKPPREALDIRSRIRFDEMIKQGAIAEVEELIQKEIPDRYPVMRALGVQELKATLTGKINLNQAIELAKLHTRQYAKRQMTWFNNRFNADYIFPSCYDNDNFFVDDIIKSL